MHLQNLTADVCDRLPEGCRAIRNPLQTTADAPLGGLFCEGYAAVQADTGARLWIGLDGRALHTSSDFAAYQAWLP